MGKYLEGQFRGEICNNFQNVRPENRLLVATNCSRFGDAKIAAGSVPFNLIKLFSANKPTSQTCTIRQAYWFLAMDTRTQELLASWGGNSPLKKLSSTFSVLSRVDRFDGIVPVNPAYVIDRLSNFVRQERSGNGVLIIFCPKETSTRLGREHKLGSGPLMKQAPR
jgi:hypothetical protein